MARKIFLLFPIFFFIACTQIIDEDTTYTKGYKGDDGCLVCHTNAERLQALAPAEEGSDSPGGG